MRRSNTNGETAMRLHVTGTLLLLASSSRLLVDCVIKQQYTHLVVYRDMGYSCCIEGSSGSANGFVFSGNVYTR